MRRADNAAQTADAARRAAEALRQAQDLLAGSQQQLASGKVDSLAREAARLRQDERSQADRINGLANAQNDETNPTDLDAMRARLRQRDQLAGERQQLSDSLSRLERNLRESARTMAPNEPGVAGKLRDALTEMDDADLDNRVQRTADWLRRGINPNATGTESDIAQGLDKLSQDLQQAQRAMGQEKPSQKDTAQGDPSALLSQVERLREQIESMSGSENGNSRMSQSTQQGQSNGQQPSSSGQLSRNGQQDGRGAAGSQPAFGPSGQNRQGGPVGAQRSGDLGNQTRSGASGDVRYSGGFGADSTVWNNINTGNNRYSRIRQRTDAPRDASANPADTERIFQQEMRQLSQLRQMTHDDPETAKEVAELTRQMQHLDPGRFPGNPAMVEQMHREVLSSVDRLELELERQGATPDVRTAKPDAVPAGYQDAVADYYKRLSSQH
jgi:hypothetical protein